MENKQNIKDLIQKFYPHAKEKLGFDHPVRVIMRQDAENAQQSLGKTAYYDPAEKLIVLYEMKLTKSQLKGLIEQTIEKITEKKFPDLTGDGKVTQADILKGRGVKLKEKEHENDSALDDDGFDAFRDAFKSVRGGKEGDSEKEKNRERFRSVARAAERTKEKRKGDGEMDEQEMKLQPAGIGDMVAVGNVLAELRELSDMDSSSSRNLQRMGQEQFFRVLADKLEKAIQDDTGAAVKDVDEMHCGGKRDDELEEQEMKPTMKGKKIKIEKEPKDSPEAAKFLQTVRDLGDKSEKEITSKSDEKEEIVPENINESKQSNDSWYNETLYKKLKSTWTK
jgi:hypothetical protein